MMAIACQQFHEFVIVDNEHQDPGNINADRQFQPCPHRRSRSRRARDLTAAAHRNSKADRRLAVHRNIRRTASARFGDIAQAYQAPIRQKIDVGSFSDLNARSPVSGAASRHRSRAGTRGRGTTAFCAWSTAMSSCKVSRFNIDLLVLRALDLGNVWNLQGFERMSST